MLDSQITHSDIASYADSNINLSSDKAKEYRNQASNLREKLERHIQEDPGFGLVKMLHSGSVAKGTALKVIHDMDVAVYVKQPLEESEDQLLNWLMERLREAYSNLKPEQFSCPSGSHCVTVSFRSTGGTGLDVDVVPVIMDDNPDDYGYLATKDTGDRVLTNITLHLDFIQRRKNAQPHHFRQVVRLIKWWVRQQKINDDSFGFKSLMVELICAHLADNGLDMSDYPSALQRFFTYIVRTGLKERISFTDYYDDDSLFDDTPGVIQIIDPVNPTNNVALKYEEADRLKIVAAATDALDALTEAQFATTKQRALDMWKVIFGPSFAL
ncbi:MAG: nucleotidyltransferase [bacterium]|nr:nucleotidyltransferase [bacterium]